MTFYHGTRRGIGRGGWVTPRSFHGGAATTAPLQPGREAHSDSVEYVYLTTDLHLAWAYAFEGVGRGKPKVLVVEPHGNVTRDPEHSAAMEAYRCDGWAKVVDVLTDPPFTEEESRAGWEVYQ